MPLPFGITAAGLANTGTFLSGASSFLSGLGIGGDKGPGTMEQINNAKAMTSGTIDSHWASTMGNAKKYGIHPLAALGVSPASGPAVYQDGKGIDLNAMGQGIDRMANAGRSSTQRTLDALAVENAKLSNDYMRVQIAGAQKALLSTGATPRMYSGYGPDLIDGQPNSGPSVKLNPAEEIAHDLKASSTEAGRGTPAYKRFRGPHGTTIYGLSEPLQEAAEGYGPIGGSVYGGALLAGTIPLYLRDASRAFVKHGKKNIKEFRKNWRNKSYWKDAFVK